MYFCELALMKSTASALLLSYVVCVCVRVQTKVNYKCSVKYSAVAWVCAGEGSGVPLLLLCEKPHYCHAQRQHFKICFMGQAKSVLIQANNSKLNYGKNGEMWSERNWNKSLYYISRYKIRKFAFYFW